MYFYKFRTLNKNSLSGLANRELWFDKLINQNDPFEGGCIIDSSLSTSLQLYAQSQIGLNHITHNTDLFKLTSVHHPEKLSPTELLVEFGKRCASDLIQRIREESLICSFSYFDEGDIDDPLFNTHMWGHYSDGLRGFCLVFDEESLSEDIFNNSGKLAKGFHVEYQNRPKSINISELLKVDNSVLKLSNELEGANLVARISTTKSEDWAREKEVRFISFSKNHLLNFKQTSLLKIVIGEKMSKPDRELLLSIVKLKYPNVEILIMKRQYNSYRLVTQPM